MLFVFFLKAPKTQKLTTYFTLNSKRVMLYQKWTFKLVFMPFWDNGVFLCPTHVISCVHRITPPSSRWFTTFNLLARDWRKVHLFYNQIIISLLFWAKWFNSCRFQPFKCQDLLLLCFISGSKWRDFESLTIGWIKVVNKRSLLVQD